MKKNKIVNIAYLGGSHGSFMLFFVDKFSKLTPDISGTPFSATGTSHSQSIKFSGQVDIATFEDLHGLPRNDYKPDPTVPYIVIEVDEKSLMNFTRLFFTRKGDQEHTATFLSVSEDKTSIHIDEHFVNRYKDNFKLLYDFDVTKTLVIPISLMRDFLKITFLRMQNDRTLHRKEINKANVPE